MIIDMHTHFVPVDLPDMSYRKGNDRWPTIKKVNETENQVMISGQIFRTVNHVCWDMDARLAEMDDEGIAAHVLSPMPELLSHWFEPKDTLEFSKHMNEKLAEMISVNANRFYGLGMVPIQEPKLAAAEVRKLKSEFGVHGVEVGSNINGIPIGDPSFLPFFEAIAEENLAVFIHPIHPVGTDRIVGPNSLRNLICFPSETGMATASLITGGVISRFPNIRIAISHGGGTFASILPRLTMGWKIFADYTQLLEKSPMDYAKQLYFDNLVYDDLTANHLVSMFGSEQILVGSDYPFIIREKQLEKFLKRLPLSQVEQEDIKRNNTLRFLGV